MTSFHKVITHLFCQISLRTKGQLFFARFVISSGDDKSSTHTVSYFSSLKDVLAFDCLMTSGFGSAGFGHSPKCYLFWRALLLGPCSLILGLGAAYMFFVLYRVLFDSIVSRKPIEEFILPARTYDRGPPMNPFEQRPPLNA